MAAKTKFPRVKSAGLRGAKTVADAQLGKRRHDSITAAIAFQSGKNDYLLFKPRPTTPTNENCDNPESMRFYGWMIQRSDDVMKIIEDITRLGLPEKKHNALMNKRVAALDRAHSPDGRDGPIW